MKSRHRVLAAVVTSCALLPLAPGAATAAPTVAKLRVEAAGRALDAGNSYVNDTAQLATAPSQCGGSGVRRTVPGPSAIGVVDYAKRVNDRLRPFYASDQFSFALIVCRIGAYGAFTANEAWLYKVNHKAPSAGGDQYRLRRGDRVLWYFANFATGQSTGDELELRTPARVRPNQRFGVRAFAYDWEGNAKPAAGVALSGDATAVTDANGWTAVKATRRGDFGLRGRRGNDIPAAPTHTCVNANLDRCPAVRGERIFGTAGADSITGTPGADAISGGGGNDRVDVGRGGPDVVSCGTGFDSVRASGNDRVARNCERVARV
jgi:Ca2+-binding RTX toxin-like protein